MNNSTKQKALGARFSEFLSPRKGMTPKQGPGTAKLARNTVRMTVSLDASLNRILKELNYKLETGSVSKNELMVAALEMLALLWKDEPETVLGKFSQDAPCTGAVDSGGVGDTTDSGDGSGIGKAKP